MRVRFVIALTVPLLSGCGFAFMAGPPSGWQSADGATLQAMAESNEASPCTLDTSNSRRAIQADQLLAYIYGISTIGIIGGALGASSVGEGVGAAIITMGGFTGLFGLSARSGETKVLDCEEFHSKLGESLAPVR